VRVDRVRRCGRLWAGWTARVSHLMGDAAPRAVHRSRESRGQRFTLRLARNWRRSGYNVFADVLQLRGGRFGTAIFTLAIGVIAPRYDLRTLMIFVA
jgi:hypothetical protein